MRVAKIGQRTAYFSTDLHRPCGVGRFLGHPWSHQVTTDSGQEPASHSDHHSVLPRSRSIDWGHLMFSEIRWDSLISSETRFGVGVWSPNSKVRGLEFEVWSSKFEVWTLTLAVWRLTSKVWSFELQVWSLGLGNWSVQNGFIFSWPDYFSLSKLFSLTTLFFLIWFIFLNWLIVLI